MASNGFGLLFRVTTFGESRGKGIGCVIDGCPAGVVVFEGDIAKELRRRAPGDRGVSQRKEPDTVEVLSGVYGGVTTGAPIALWIKNCDVVDDECEVLRPGHADITYTEKYGAVDLRGGGRASARETAARVAAGSVAKQFMAPQGIRFRIWVSQIGERVFTEEQQGAIGEFLEDVRGDSLGGVVSACVEGIPSGLGDPMYEKLTARLACAMFSIPASRGFEIGEGFFAATMKGSTHNDCIGSCGVLASNHAGGVLGGISTGETLVFRVAFKPTSSIGVAMQTMTKDGMMTSYATKNILRQDPCVAFRAVPVVEAMTALVLADAMLMQRLARM